MKVYRKRKPRANTHLTVMLFLICMIILILVGSFIVMAVNDNRNLNDISIGYNSSENESSSSSFADKNSNGKDDSSITTGNDGVNGKDETLVRAVENDGVTVSESKYTNMTYFDDALFIGDSISEGLKLYQVLPAANVLANQSVGVDQVARGKPVYMTAKGKVTLDEALKGKKPKKIYLMLGMNGMPGYSNEAQIKYYEQVVDKLIKKYPSAIIYLQSVTPVTYKKSQEDKNLNNEKITKFNTMIKSLAKEKDVYYLDVASALKTKNGNLSKEYAGADGIHFKKEGHLAMLEYYRYHTVSVKKSELENKYYVKVKRK